MEQKRFWLFFAMILLVIVGLLLVFVFTGKDEGENDAVPLLTYVLDAQYSDRMSRTDFEYLVARGGTSPFGIKIVNVSLAKLDGDSFVLLENGTFNRGDKIVLQYELQDIIPKKEGDTFAVALERTLSLRTKGGEFVGGFNERYPYTVKFSVQDDQYYRLPHTVIIESNELIPEEYELLIQVEDNFNTAYKRVEFTLR